MQSSYQLSVLQQDVTLEQGPDRTRELMTHGRSREKWKEEPVWREMIKFCLRHGVEKLMEGRPADPGETDGPNNGVFCLETVMEALRI